MQLLAAMHRAAIEFQAKTSLILAIMIQFNRI